MHININTFIIYLGGILAISNSILCTKNSSHDFDNKKVLFCYYASWDRYTTGFLAKDIDPFLCTHIIYAFAYIHPKNYTIYDVELKHKEIYQDLHELKLRNSKLKLLLAIGGWTFDQTIFSALVQEPSDIRHNFILHVIDYLRKWHFDGICIDWRYPGLLWRNGNPYKDPTNFPIFLQQMRQAFTNEVNQTQRKANDNNMSKISQRLILSIIGYSSVNEINVAYKVYQISPQVDYILLTSYNYNGCWSSNKKTAYDSPLAGKYVLNINATINEWIFQGNQSEKLVLGIGLNTLSYRIDRKSIDQCLINVHDKSNVKNNSFTGCGQGLPALKCGIFQTLSVAQLCRVMGNKSLSLDWRNFFDATSKSYSAYSIANTTSKPLNDIENTYNNIWITYENYQSFEKKAELIRQHGLAGASVWLLSGDYYNKSHVSPFACPQITGFGNKTHLKKFDNNASNFPLLNKLKQDMMMMDRQAK